MAISKGRMATVLSPLERRIVELLSVRPDLHQKELAHAAGVARNTAMRAVAQLIRRGVIGERGYYVPQPHKITEPTGLVLFKSPDNPEDIDKLERILNYYRHIGSWSYISSP